ncbi:MAG: cation:proton antiporter, partial [Myxococcales bacterium]
VQIIGLGAPDVGLTVLLTEALTVVVMMLVLQRLPLRFGRSSRVRRLRVGALAAMVGLAAAVATYLTTGRQGRSELGTWYLENTYDLSGGANVVNVILVEFRAFDTFGEMAVLGMAGVVMVAVLSTVRSRHIDTATEHDRPPAPALRDDEVVRRAVTDPVANQLALRRLVRVLNPVLLVTAVIVLLQGHNNPGGGFIAALIMSCTIGLTYVSTAHDRAIGPVRLPLRLISGGILIAVAVGLVGLVTKDTFLGALHGYLFDYHLTSGMVFDLGIIGAVLGLVLLAFNLLGAAASTASSARSRVPSPPGRLAVEAAAPSRLNASSTSPRTAPMMPRSKTMPLV